MARAKEKKSNNLPPAASKPPARKRAPSAKARAQAKKPKKSCDDDSSDDSADEGGTEANSKTVPHIKQGVKKVLALIAEDKDIKQSLYPPCGPNASSSNGGGKPKIDAQWELANLLLGDDEKYKESLKAAAAVPKDKNG
ncbi:hypothetical protein B0H14DRAFT_3565952 [Mycena olivaceomarginata]|nr:hypothetical protein B0H14DRAFT_3565952 [Mycena olivaceomarginata]